MFQDLKVEYLKELSPSEYEILEYIFKNKNKVLNMSIQELSTTTFFSTATIMRLCKKLKLSGFSELKYYLKQSILEQEDNVSQKISIDTMEDYFSKQITDTLALTNRESIEAVTDILESDRNVHLFGKGITSEALKYFSKYLLTCNRMNICYDDTHIALLAAANMDERDVVILASNSGATQQVLKLAQIAKANKAFIVSFTGLGKNPLAELSNINFYVASSPFLDCSYDIASRVPFMMVFDLIVNRYIYNQIN
ncbi:MAG: MurR/RpiR family transcriptional regulator [Clostridiaceae bacterium]